MRNYLAKIKLNNYRYLSKKSVYLWAVQFRHFMTGYVSFFIFLPQLPNETQNVNTRVAVMMTTGGKFPSPWNCSKPLRGKKKFNFAQRAFVNQPQLNSLIRLSSRAGLWFLDQWSLKVAALFLNFWIFPILRGARFIRSWSDGATLEFCRNNGPGDCIYVPDLYRWH